MKEQTRELILSHTSERAIKIQNTREAVDSMVSQDARHKLGQAFAQAILPLLLRYVEDDSSVKKEEIISICRQEKNHLQRSALLFCEEAFHTQLVNAEEDDAGKKDIEKAWRYRELAYVIMEQPDIIGIQFLDWAYFCWHEELFCVVELSDSKLSELLAQIDADKIKYTRHNQEYYAYGGSYLEIPEWIEYLIAYLEAHDKYDMLRELIERLVYVELQDAAAFHMRLPETFVEVVKVNTTIAPELTGIMISHWYRELVQQGAILRGYSLLQNEHQLIIDGKKIYTERESSLNDSVRSTLDFFIQLLGRNAVERWYFGECHYHGENDSNISESEKETRQIVEFFLFSTFKPSDAMTDFTNADYLIFLGEECERLQDKNLASSLRIAFDRFLFSSEMYKLTKFDDRLLNLLRAYSLPMRMEKTVKDEYRLLMGRFLTRHEGLGMKMDDDFNNEVQREVFVLSSLLLIAEDEDILEGNRKQIFNEVAEHVLMQLRSCWMDHLQEKYIEALKVAYLVLCQQWDGDRRNFELQWAQSIDSLYMLAMVLSVGEHELCNDAKVIIRKRWVNEHTVIYVSVAQIHRMNLYNALKKWVEERT